MHVKITNTDLIREMESQAVLSTNKTELSRYTNARQNRLKELRRQQRLEDKMVELEKKLESLSNIIQNIGNHNDQSNQYS